MMCPELCWTPGMRGEVLARTTGLHLINMVVPDFIHNMFGLLENVMSPPSEKS